MSRGVIELLNYVTEKANCDTDTYSQGPNNTAELQCRFGCAAQHLTSYLIGVMRRTESRTLLNMQKFSSVI